MGENPFSGFSHPKLESLRVSNSFFLFTLEENENLKKKKTFEKKRMRLSLPNLFNLFPLLYFFLFIVVIHFIVMF